MNDAMDVMGGAGICRGKNNMLGNAFMSMPIAITVEGANILTRSMITFGQGLNRAHPNLIKIVNSLEKGDDLQGFTKEAFGFLGHLGANTGRSLSRAVMRPRSKKDLVGYYEGQLGRLSSNFAVSADLALVLGGRLKFEEMLSGRFADAFGTLYLGYSCLWYYKQLQASGADMTGMDAILEISMESILLENQTAIYGLAENFPIPGIGPLISTLCFPLGKSYHGPNDAMRKKAADIMTTPSGFRKICEENIFISEDPTSRVRMLIDTLPLSVAADKAVAAAKKAKRALTADEQEMVNRVTAAADILIQVDSFDKLGAEVHTDATYVRPALMNTKFEHMAVIEHGREPVMAGARA
jgi:acyl-CoA dehydrogenase